MRVAYVCTDPGVPVFGRKGASVHVQAVLRALVRRGDDVHLLTVRPGGRPERELASVHVHPLPLTPSADPAEREVCVQYADAAAGGVLDRLHQDGGLDLVYERYSLWGRSATRWARFHGVRSLVEVNAPLVQEQATHRVLVDQPAAQRVAEETLTGADTVVCVSDAVASWVHGIVGDGEHVHTLANGVDTTRVFPRPGPVTPAVGNTFTVGFVGTLKPWHGVHTLLDACAKLVAADPSYRLLVVGDGPLADTVRARADAAGLGPRLEMTGAVAPSRVPALLRQVDAAVAPYPPLDAFYFSPLKLYEYLAAGLPVVSSRVGDLPQILDHGRLGVLVEPGDADALASAVAGLRADTAERARLRAAGRRRAVERHDWSRVLQTALTHAGVEATSAPAFGRSDEEARRAVVG
jgi:glycosyltransferase involved in cell wall biosynthesis